MILPTPGARSAARAGDHVRSKRGLVLVSAAVLALSVACGVQDALVGAQDPDVESGKVGAATGGTGTGNAAGRSADSTRGGSSAGDADDPIMGGTGEGIATTGSAGGTSEPPDEGGTEPWPAVEAEPGKVPWEGWPEVEEAPAASCRVSIPSAAGDSAGPTPFRTETWHFDAVTRVLTVNEEGDGLTDPWVEYVRFDDQGRRQLQYSSISPDYCHEWFRDPLGNTDTFFLTMPLPGDFDPTTTYPDARQGAHETTRYDHEYDDRGRLESTWIHYPGRGGRQTFFRDADVRCHEILSEISPDEYSDQVGAQELERWTYQGARLATRVTTAAADSTDVRRVVRFGYDATGTLASTVVDGYAAIPQPYPVVKPRYDGAADYVVRTAEQPDGSRWLEVLDFTRPTPNAEVLRDGVSTPVFRRRWHFSAGCRMLNLPKRTSRDCEFDRPLYMLPIGWDDPYFTPIRPQTPAGAY